MQLTKPMTGTQAGTIKVSGGAISPRRLDQPERQIDERERPSGLSVTLPPPAREAEQGWREQER